MEKKLIRFEDELTERIKEFSENYKKTFTDSVKILIQLGLKSYYDGNEESISNSLDIKIKNLEKKIEEMTWWSADEGNSKLHQLKVSIEEFEKKFNVLSAASKLFKGHIEDRSIHLQD